jgi:hypothetical protein
MKNFIPRIFSMLLTMAGPVFAAELHVAVTGSDGNPGTSSKPFATIERAQREVAGLRSRKPDQSVTVTIGPGRFLLREGLFFASEDSGTAGSPVIYRGAPDGATRLSAGVIIPPSALKPLADPALEARLRPEAAGKIHEIDLDGLEISPGRMPDTFRKIEILEVFHQSERLPLSRWPNAPLYTTMKTVTDSALTSPQGGTFVYREEDPGRWLAALEDGGVWVRGFWRVPWVIEAVKVARIDKEARTITLAGHVTNGIGSKYARDKTGKGRGDGKEPWHVFNLIDEIDRPGEWSVNFRTRKLHVWLPSAPADGALLVSDRNKPLVRLFNASHITFQNLTLDGSLGHGVAIEGGENIRWQGCRIRNVGDHGVHITGGKNHLVLSCDVSATGQTGIRVTGGERSTLTPGGHQILNNLVTGIGVHFPAYAVVLGEGWGPNARTESVGNRAAHNRIHDVPSAGIVFSGNENLMELNEIYRCGMGSGDLGAFYTNSGWTARGNIIRNNMVHHSMNANAFYVDDGSCGSTIEGNIVYKAATGGFVGGGHDHIFRHNIIMQTGIAMHIDNRGVARKYTAQDRRLLADLNAMPYQTPPWSERYPQLVTLLERTPESPSGLVVESNLYAANTRTTRFFTGIAESPGFSDKDNLDKPDLALFTDPAQLDFRILPGAEIPPALAPLREIPFERIGLQKDEFRQSVPARDMKLLLEGETKKVFDSLQDIEASNRQQP